MKLSENEAKPTILLTGAAGFIGSHLTDRLLNDGNQVIGLDNLSLGRRSNLSVALGNPDFTWVEADLLDEESCFSKLRDRKVDLVWHMAANSNIAAGAADPGVDLRDTFLSTFHTLSLMKRLKCEALLFASSSAIYGEKAQTIDEDLGPLFPVSQYGAMKLASEGVITAALESHLKRVWIFRFPNVVGARATHGVIHDFTKKLYDDPTELKVLGDGSQEKPYLHVTELIEAMILAYRKATDKLNYYNIGQIHSSTTVRHIAEEVRRTIAPAARISYGMGSKGWIGDISRFSFSVKKIQELGWVPQLNSNESVNRAIREIAEEWTSAR